MSADAPFDRAALEALYVRLERPLYNVVYRWTWEPQVAQEIVQDAFVRLWRMRDRVRPDTVEALVYRIALNRARNHRRWRRLRTFFGLRDDAVDPALAPDTALAAHGDARRLRAAIEALPDDLREVMVLTTFSELTYGEIAQLTGVREGTVGSRRNRALAELRRTVGGTGG
ncbi:MAG: sigma-70 family RNA polymerase sigma factor [Myxococcota bacterium]